ncbi:hypothetical protein N7540_008580 [Penicillium herquei]|nr:hypothetical protein N7540_008580 [Penicillium herquei]
MASQSDQSKKLNNVIQSTISFSNALWDYWGAIIHEDDNLQLRDGTFKGLDRAVRAYLNSLGKLQKKKTQDASAHDPDLIDPRDRLIQSQRETIERQNRGFKRACTIIEEVLSKNPPNEDFDAQSNTIARNDQSRCESDELEERHEEISRIPKKTIQKKT